MANSLRFVSAGILFLLAAAAIGSEKTDSSVAAAAADAEDLCKLGLDDSELLESTDTQPAFSNVPLLLGPADVIRLTAKYSPAIRHAYERKVAEEARYRFFMADRQSFSYGAASEFDYNRIHDDYDHDIEKTVSPQVFVRKEFYNTTRTSLGVGYDFFNDSERRDGNVFVTGGVLLPLFASREALQRSNDKIYQQNKVNDARLEYFREIRHQILEALEAFSDAARDQEILRYQTQYLADLKDLLGVAMSTKDRDTSGDRGKIEATIASEEARYASSRNAFEISKERLKMAMGIPFETPVEVKEEEFNPFNGEDRVQLEKVALATDEEIKTLLNSIRSSQAELVLARKGKWDTSLFVNGRREFAGAGGDEGSMGYGVATGVAVTHIDNRILKSLEDIALASIRGYKNALLARRREIHTNTADAFSTLQSQTAEVRARETNIPRFGRDFADGIEGYRAGQITIDALIQKRQDLYYEMEEVAHGRAHGLSGVANLLASTGRYEQFLEPDSAVLKEDAACDASAPAIESTAGEAPRP